MGLPTAPPASAYNFAQINNVADNSLHTWYPWALESGTLAALRFAMATRLESTDMTTDEFQSQNADTDVVAVDPYYGTDAAHDWWGMWTCDTFTTTGRCNKGTMRFNLSWGPITTCVSVHETGHSVGLDHRVEDPPVDVMYRQCLGRSWNDYDSHDRMHINGFY
jgi:hypothetical protein